MRPRRHALLYINGVRHEIGADRAGMMLADFLRVGLGLTGTKIVCAEGDCGACTVLRFFPGLGPRKLGRSRAFLPVNSCITTLAQLDGSSLVTVEALGSPAAPHPVQDAMRSCHGSQCGFCTPGFVMALGGLVEKRLARGETGKLEPREAANALTGNLCRCTGYQQIVEAACAVDVAACESVSEKFYPAAQERELRAALATPLLLEGDSFRAFAPTSVKAAAQWLARAKGARVLAAATDLGVVRNKGKLELDHVLSLHLVPELHELKASRGALRVGARVTIAELRRALKSRAPEIARFLDLFASPQIKNIATLVGNVANASPIADTPPFLLACDAVVLLQGPRGKRAVPLAEFYLGYRKTALRTGELVTGIELPLPGKGEELAVYKVSERKDLDISCVNAGLRVKRDSKGVIEDARVALGGVAATPVRLPRTEKALRGSAPSAELRDRAVAVLQAEIAPISDVRGSSAFRRVLAGNLLRRFFRERLGVSR